LLKATRDRWVAWWLSAQAVLVDRALDGMAVERLFRYYDEWERYARLVRSGGRLTPGSVAGTEVVAPAMRAMLSLEAQMRPLEERFGITPVGRMRLGIDFAAALKAGQEARRMIAADEDEVEEYDVAGFEVVEAAPGG
jgi:phage terminase small subunit